ncbi:pentapeptide repeat-containing protein [Actinoplanes sp. CA-015351]|uniref:pentapeptide repeat-containing protein n=1 Tax=Actinoplanes sp. CA-015351 TaxID=3239897 RepID=UPI003D98ACDD
MVSCLDSAESDRSALSRRNRKSAQSVAASRLTKDSRVGAWISSSNLPEANLSEANLSEADLSEAKVPIRNPPAAAPA